MTGYCGTSGFLRPSPAQGRRRIEPGRTQTIGRSRPSGAHAVEFSKTVAPGDWRGFLLVALAGQPGGSQRGQRSIARLPRSYQAPERPPLPQQAGNLALSIRDLDVDRPFPRPVVEIDQHDLLPGAEHEAPPPARNQGGAAG